MKYVTIFLSQVHTQLSYKFNLFVGIFSNVIRIAVTFFMWQTIFNNAQINKIGGFTKEEMLLYILVTNLSAIVFSAEYVVRLGGLVRSGKLTTLLLRPINLLKESLAMYLGQRFVFFSIYVILFLVIIPKSSLLITGLIVLFIIVNFLMFFLLISCIATFGFWVVQMWPLRPLVNALFLLFGGLYFPLNLLPKGIYNFLEYNPFSLVGYSFTLAIQGKTTVEQLARYLFATILWSIFFYIVYKFLYRKGLKKYEGMGA